MTRALAPLAAALALTGLAGCASLIAPVLKPDVSAAPEGIPAGDYTLDTKHASILFKIDHLGYSTYIGRFETWDASLTGDAAAPENARLTATVDMTSLDLANDEFAKTLMGPDWFDAAQFPTARFETISVTVTSPTTADVTGTLTLHGQSAPITLSATLNGAAYDRLRGADVIGFSATTTLDRTDFGVDKYSGLITDSVTLEIEAEFVKG